MQKIVKDRIIPSMDRGSYPWHGLEVGDSFDVPAGKVGSVRAAARVASMTNGKVFRVFRTEDGGHACWRVS